LMLGIIVMSIISGRLITRWGRYRIFPIVGTATLVAGFGLMSTFGVGTTQGQVSVAMVLIGLGLGNIMQVIVLAVQNAVDAGDLGIATSASQFFRSIGGTVGVALFGAILNNRLTANLAPILRELPPGISPETLTQSPKAIAGLPPGLASSVREAVASSIHVAFLVGIPVALAAFAISFRLKELPLRETAHVGGVEGAEGAMLAELGESSPEAVPELVAREQRG
ncbi:MAG: hypothetical protein ACRDKZ_08175, partial [Actinomycetota bacterium]